MRTPPIFAIDDRSFDRLEDIERRGIPVTARMSASGRIFFFVNNNFPAGRVLSTQPAGLPRDQGRSLESQNMDVHTPAGMTPTTAVPGNPLEPLNRRSDFVRSMLAAKDNLEKAIDLIHRDSTVATMRDVYWQAEIIESLLSKLRRTICSLHNDFPPNVKGKEGIAR